MTTKKTKTLSYSLGVCIGSEIVENKLPTLSCDMLKTRKVIQVTWAEAQRLKKLDDKYHALWRTKKVDEAAKDKSWKELQAYRRVLEEKYLPKEIECVVTWFDLEQANIDEVKEGISDAIWDCDLSHYSHDSKDISLYYDDYNFLIVKLIYAK